MGVRGYGTPAHLYYVATVLFRFFCRRNVSLQCACLYVWDERIDQIFNPGIGVGTSLGASDLSFPACFEIDTFLYVKEK